MFDNIRQIVVAALFIRFLGALQTVNVDLIAVGNVRAIQRRGQRVVAGEVPLVVNGAETGRIDASVVLVVAALQQVRHGDGARGFLLLRLIDAVVAEDVFDLWHFHIDDP